MYQGARDALTSRAPCPCSRFRSHCPHSCPCHQLLIGLILIVLVFVVLDLDLAVVHVGL
jgi:hypothetical protein